ncbi:MAG: hypothetical protein LBS84_02225 [Clostridiales bacterium]|jgi:RNA-binding protein YlmH|nr:hypothetical protein [Clostridiales bacterium]
MDKQELLKRFQTPDEKLLLSKVLDRLFLCQTERQKTFTSFLDPLHAVKIAEIIRARADEKLLTYGGAPGCERKMLGFAPAFEQLEFIDFPIDRVSVRFPLKFGSGLSHRDFLGSLIGLGIDRGKIGDINIDGGEAEVYAHRDVGGFICANLDRVGRVKVTADIERVETVFWDTWQEFKPDDGREMIINISSTRIDTIISSVFRVARGASAKLITGGKVSVNWTPVTRNDKVVNEGDTITVRGHGRVRVEAIEQSGKKERFAVRAVKYS